GERRHRLLAAARGRVVEIGPGTGLNFAHYTAAVTGVVALEPDPHMLRRARAAAGRAPVPVRLLRAAAERLPLGDDGFAVALAPARERRRGQPAVAGLRRRGAPPYDRGPTDRRRPWPSTPTPSWSARDTTRSSPVTSSG